MQVKVLDSPEHLIIQKSVSHNEYRLIIIPHPVLETFFLEHVKGESSSELTVLVDAEVKNKPPAWEKVLRTIILTIEVQVIKAGFDEPLVIPHKEVKVLLCQSYQKHYMSSTFEGCLVYTSSQGSPLQGGERAISKELAKNGFNSNRRELERALEGLPLQTTRTFIFIHLHVAPRKPKGRLFRH